MITDHTGGHPQHLTMLDLANPVTRTADAARISNADICRHGNVLGQLLARGAKPVAGTWQLPTGLKEPTMHHEIHWQEALNWLRRFSKNLLSAYHVRQDMSAVEARKPAGGQESVFNAMPVNY